MRADVWACAVAGLVLTGLASGAEPSGPEPVRVDLAKVDRALKREPAYKGKPRYCLLVLGAEARTRVWLVVDDEHLYVDRNGDGDLTGAGEAVPLAAADQRNELFDGERRAKGGEVREGSLVHTELTVIQRRFRVAADPKTPAERLEAELAARSSDGCMYDVSLAVDVSRLAPAGAPAPRKVPMRVEQIAWADEGGLLYFALTPKAAPVLHFNGPFAMGLMPRQVLRRGDAGTELRTSIVTPGAGAGSTVYLRYMLLEGLVPDGVGPVVEAEFPPVTPAAGAVKARYELGQRCCGNQFHDRVKVPAGAGAGAAKLTLSLPGWKEGRVAPAAVEVPVADPTKEVKPDPGKP